MKLSKSKFSKRLIIVLIILMIFNVVAPKKVKAWDLGGILIKPFSAIVLSNLVSIDVTIGTLLNGFSIGTDLVGSIIELFTNDKEEALNNASDGLSKLFIGPDSIFSGQVMLFNANIFEATSSSLLNPIDTITEITNAINSVDSGVGGKLKAISVTDASKKLSPGYHMITTIRKGVASVYITLRNICGFIMLAGLIFTGIRILITSNTPTKMATWRALLQDWFIGMILLIFSHVIMVGIFYVSDLLTAALSDSSNGFGGLNFNLIVKCLKSFDSAEQIICLIMLGYMIWLTIVFAVAYFKRLMWICVLTVIAPIVSVMYAFGPQTKPIYSKWLREYITTVLIQPFHVIIYYTLTAIPLKMVESSGWSLTGTNLLEIVYALAAMSFIRPAEKYIRGLFGMNQGITELASYDSGKKTVVDIGKTAATVAVTAATAGVGGAAMGAIKGGKAMHAVASVGKDVLGNSTLGTIGKGAISGAETVLDAGGKVGGKIASKVGKMTGLIDADVAKPISMPKGGGEPPINLDDQIKQLEEEYAQTKKREKEYSDSGYYDKAGVEHGNAVSLLDKIQDMKMQKSIQEDNKDEKNREETYTDNMNKTEEKQENPYIIDKAGTTEEKEPVKIDLDNLPKEEKNTEEKTNKNTNENTKETSGLDSINAENILINGNNIRFQADNNLDAYKPNEEEKKIDTAENTPQLDETSNKKETEKKEEKDEPKDKNGTNARVSKEGKDIDTNKKEKIIPRNLRRTLAFTQLATGRKGIMDTLNDVNPNSKLGKFTGRFTKSELGQSLGKFEDLGGIKQLHEGFNKIRDGFYATPPSDDWKATNEQLGERQKEREEQIKFDISNNDEYLNYLMYDDNGPKLYDKYKQQYPDKSDAYVKAMAKEKAESKVKSLSDTYVPLGIRDIPTMYKCEEDRKTYGLTAQEAVVQQKEYESFNLDSDNISYINGTYNTNYSSVTEAFGKDPDDKTGKQDLANTYYKNGYKDVGSMALVNELSTLLNVSTKYGMQLDKALRKQGGEIQYDKTKLTPAQNERLTEVLGRYKSIQNNTTIKE